MLKKYFGLAFALLLHATNFENLARTNTVLAVDSTIITEKGMNVTIECNKSCNFDSPLWTYKQPHESAFEDLVVVGSSFIRNKIPGRKDEWYKIINGTKCKQTLFLPEIQFEATGVYACWEGLLSKGVTNVIVVNTNKHCSTDPDFSDLANILLKQNDSITIRCSFQYSADQSCIATPIWTDLTGYRNLTIPANDFEANMDDKHAWIHFKPGADIRNGIRINLSFAFNCSPTNSNDTIQSSGRYYFGLIPFRIYVNGISFNNRSNVKMADANTLIIIGINAALAVLMIFFLFLVFLKKFSQLCFARSDERTNNDISDSDATAVTKEGYIGIRKDLRPEDTNVYDAIGDGNYESIGDPGKPECIVDCFHKEE